MTNYREILRLRSLGLSERDIARSCNCSRNTVALVIKRAEERNLKWPLDTTNTNSVLKGMLYPPKEKDISRKRKPDFAYIRKELLRNGVSKKLLWAEYMEECRLNNEEPLMYSQFCYYIQEDEQQHRASMHIKRRPGELIEVDWAGDPAGIIDPDTGETTDAFLFLGVCAYSQYTYVEAFINQQLGAWIKAHVNMYTYFGGVSKILTPDNTKTAVTKNSIEDPKFNATYHEMAEHYNTAIIPARVRKPKDKPNVEGNVGYVSTWITAALRNEQFFSLPELNASIREKLKNFNLREFQKKEGCRKELFINEELPLLTPLPATSYEVALWKKATVQFNYHISVDGMLYSVPYEYIKKKVDVRITDKTVEVFHNQDRIASHARLRGRSNQYSTITDHMPKKHQQFLEWNGDRFRRWADQIGVSTADVVNSILSSAKVEQQAYRSLMALLKLSERYSPEKLEAACEKALTFTAAPSYKSVKNILLTIKNSPEENANTSEGKNNHGITRGANYYGGGDNDQ